MHGFNNRASPPYVVENSERVLAFQFLIYREPRSKSSLETESEEVDCTCVLPFPNKEGLIPTFTVPGELISPKGGCRSIHNTRHC